MKLLVVVAVVFALVRPTAVSGTEGSDNPFFEAYDTPFGVPPFDRIRVEHFVPAFDSGLVAQAKEIDAIADNPAAPTFENTVEAMERSGRLLSRVSDVFFNLNSACTSDRLQGIAKGVAPRLSAHEDDIRMNARLFGRVKAVYGARSKLGLSREQNRMVEETYKEFVRGGANVSPDKKDEFRRINEELSVLSLRFGENVLNETNAFELVIENKLDLAGLPKNVCDAAARTADRNGHSGAWMFTLNKPSLIPFLQFSERRELREKMFKGYISRGDSGGDADNNKILGRMVGLRLRRANLLGYKTHADYVLSDNMAKTPDRVYALLDKLWKPALERAKREAAEIQGMIESEGGGFKLAPWDWWYYAEKLKKSKYDLDEEELRPYFELDNVRAGAFEVANRLYGITFEERHDLPVYQKDVRVFDVKNPDGSHRGLYYVDYFPRDNKRGGAWMSAYRKQQRADGKNVTPIVCNVLNFSSPTGDTPALLSFDEVATLFHEFGHALQGLLSECEYESLSGTAVATDFVELPSQVMENWALEPEVLRLYARHFRTGAVIPDRLVAKIRNSRLFNQGFATVEYLAASYLDMDWHTITDARDIDTAAFERASLDRIGLIPQIVVRYRSPYFRHIFAGGYSSGYYSYIWAEVLDADAFQAFKECGLFDSATAWAFRRNILAAGGTDGPMALYVKFRGREPKIESLLERRGLN